MPPKIVSLFISLSEPTKGVDITQSEFKLWTAFANWIVYNHKLPLNPEKNMLLCKAKVRCCLHSICGLVMN